MRRIAPAAALFVLAGFARPQGETKAFPAVDPYTRNTKEALEKAGYVSFGPFRFGDDHTTEQIETVLGGVPLIWVETAHFKIGSGLPECAAGEDSNERERLRDELERLAQRVPNVKVKAKKLDPWLRLHLFAARLEQTYADFQQLFGVKDGDFPTVPATPEERLAPGYMGDGPYLGMPSKFTVLLFDKESSLARYASVYLNMKVEAALRWFFPRTGSMLYLAAAELLEGDYANDTAFTCQAIGGVVQNLANGFRNYGHTLPLFWSEGLAHWFSRRFDARYHFFQGDAGTGRVKDGGKWESSVRARVERDVFPPTAEMLGWQDPLALEWADHLILWSRVDYLMAREDGAAARFQRLLKTPLVESGGRPREELLRERTEQAFREATGQTPEDFDAAWSAWVERTYPAK